VRDWARTNLADCTLGLLAAFTAAHASAAEQVKNVAHDGNITLGDVIAIARIMRPRSMARELTGTVREVLGTCQSVGCTIDGHDAQTMLNMVAEGEVEIPSK
jgi:large subunit ribosomal protein L12e